MDRQSMAAQSQHREGSSALLPQGIQDDLLAMVCHELRSPLASLRQAVRLLGSATPEAAPRVQMQALMERQVCCMSTLVEDLLDVSRFAHGRMQLHPRQIDLRVVIDNALQTTAPAIEARCHELTCALPAGPVWLMGDALRLEQVFVNLLGNAAKYTEPGGHLAVWFHVRATQAVVRVRDSGIGMAPRLVPRVFDLYRQADESDTQTGSGLGVGLALVRNLVQLHGGSVAAASRGPGRGSLFTVRLPRVVMHQEIPPTCGLRQGP
jgi:signal transduction histidine kinase